MYFFFKKYFTMSRFHVCLSPDFMHFLQSWPLLHLAVWHQLSGWKRDQIPVRLLFLNSNLKNKLKCLEKVLTFTERFYILSHCIHKPESTFIGFYLTDWNKVVDDFEMEVKNCRFSTLWNAFIISSLSRYFVKSSLSLSVLGYDHVSFTHLKFFLFQNGSNQFELSVWLNVY